MSKKSAYQEKLEAQLHEWDAKIDVLKAKAEKSNASAKAQHKEMIEDLKKKRAAAKDKLQELQRAGEDAWEALKDGVEKSWTELGSALESAKEKFE